MALVYIKKLRNKYIWRHIPDSRLYAGGITMMTRGDFLNPHIDNSHDGERKLYRMLSLLYYVTPDWKPEYGGSLELWDDAVKKAVVIPSLFNRLVIMETNRHSWHSVNPVRSDGWRCCVSNYYFSEHSPDGSDYFHVISFSARPDQTFRRWISGRGQSCAHGHTQDIQRGHRQKGRVPAGPVQERISTPALACGSGARMEIHRHSISVVY